MVVFYIIIILIGSIVLYFLKDDKSKNNNMSSDINNIAKTEMMADMYKDITGDKLDSVEKSILFMHNSNKNK